MSVPTYDINLSYDDNYTNGPVFSGTLPDLAKINRLLPEVKFLGYRLHSTFGVPAGPLLNSAYIKLYADLGFDVLTYKTVRSLEHPSHPFPNVCAVDATPSVLLAGGAEKPNLVTLPDDDEPLQQLSITNSIGMPSRPPQIWQRDVYRARHALHDGQMLVVSVVGTAKAGGTLAELADDFALTADMAARAGADAIEANLSCPNVQSREGSLYQSAEAVALVSQAMAKRLGDLPFMLKIGYLPDAERVRELLHAAVENGARGIAAINTIPANVRTPDGQQALPGEGRLVSGICGAAIKPAGMQMVSLLLQARQELDYKPEQVAIVGVGGVMTARDAQQYYECGADGVQSGTGAMWNPFLAQEYKQLVSNELAAFSF